MEKSLNSSLSQCAHGSVGTLGMVKEIHGAVSTSPFKAGRVISTKWSLRHDVGVAAAG